MTWVESRQGRIALVGLLGAGFAWAGCTPAKTPAPAPTAPRAATPAQAVAPTGPGDDLTSGSWPRLEPLWSRAGLGRFDGVVRDDVYYTVANDGHSVHAIASASGKSLWQLPLS